MKRHHEPPVLLYFCRFPGWLAWFSLQIFCLNNKIHFSLANAKNSASFKRKIVGKWRFLLIHKQQTNLWMKLPTILPGLAGKIVKYRPLAEPIRLQDLEDSARSQAWKNKEGYFWDFIYGHLCTTVIGFVYFTQEITRTQTKSRLSAGSLGTRLRGSQVGEVGEVCGNLLPLRRIFDNFRSLLTFENSRRCSNDLWALKDTITSACFDFVRTQSHHSKPFWNIFVEIELNFR